MTTNQNTETPTPDNDDPDCRIAAVYGRDFVDFVNAINRPFMPVRTPDALDALGTQ